MFWAWEKHQRWREAMREEGRQEARKAEQAKMLSHLEKVAKETGIPLAELLPPRED